MQTLRPDAALYPIVDQRLDYLKDVKATSTQRQKGEDPTATNSSIHRQTVNNKIHYTIY